MKIKPTIQKIDDRRRINRIPTNSESGFNIFLIINGQKRRAELADVSSLGISIKNNLDDLDLSLVQRVELFYGSKAAGIINNPKFHIRKDKRTVGIEELAVLDTGHRPMRTKNRLNINRNFVPTIIAANPFDPHDVLHFQVQNLNADGLLLKTSKRNKKILPGLIFKDCDLVLPALGFFKISFQLKHSSVVEDQLFFGCQLVEPSKELIQAFVQYALFGTQITNKASNNAFEELKKAGLTSKKLAKGLSVQLVSSNEELIGALRVRYEAYKDAKKILDDVTVEDMLDEYDEHSLIYVATFNGICIATFRMTFFEKREDEFPFEKTVPFPLSLGVSRKDVYEISRLAVMPGLQGTDIVLRIFQEVAKQGVISRKYLLMLSTTSLRHMYLMLGAKIVSPEIPHPVLENETMALLALKTADYINARKIKALSWDIVVKSIGNHLFDAGLIEKPKIRPWVSIMKLMESYFLQIKKKRKNKI